METSEKEIQEATAAETEAPKRRRRSRRKPARSEAASAGAAPEGAAAEENTRQAAPAETADAPAPETPANEPADEEHKNAKRPRRRKSTARQETPADDTAAGTDTGAAGTHRDGQQQVPAEKRNDRKESAPEKSRKGEQEQHKESKESRSDRNKSNKGDKESRNKKNAAGNGNGNGNNRNNGNRRGAMNRVDNGYPIISDAELKARPHAPHPPRTLFGRPIGEYFVQLAIVIIGVLIILLGSCMIHRIQAGRQTRRTMELVRTELQSNRVAIDKLRAVTAKEIAEYETLVRYIDRIDAMPADSVPRRLTMTGTASYTQHAMQTMQHQTIAGGNIPQAIFRCYEQIGETVRRANALNEQKADMIHRMQGECSPAVIKRLLRDRDMHLYLQTCLSSGAMYNFCLSRSSQLKPLLAQCEGTLAAIDETLAAIEREFRLTPQPAADSAAQ